MSREYSMKDFRTGMTFRAEGKGNSAMVMEIQLNLKEDDKKRKPRLIAEVHIPIAVFNGLPSKERKRSKLLEYASERIELDLMEINDPTCTDPEIVVMRERLEAA